MKEPIILLICTICTLLLGFVVGRKDHNCHTLTPNIEAALILESVHNDTMLQKFILDPTYRLRVKEAEKHLK